MGEIISSLRKKKGNTALKGLTAFGLGILLFMQPVSVAAGAPGDQIHQTIDKLIATLKDPRLKQASKKTERREELKKLICQRFDFTEMAKRSLGPEWRRHTVEEHKEFVNLFTDLLERAYLEQIESYSGQKVQYLNERDDPSYAEVDTKIVDNKGQEFSVKYRLHNVNGDWKVYDVVIEDVSLINNYRAQFSRVLASSSYQELVRRLKEKT
jgi:phospholipid transport system substrate-binding protein